MKKTQGLIHTHDQKKLYLVRHGETALNADGDKIRGWKDIPLNEKGIKDAYIVAEKLKGKPIDIIICSNLLRAMQTAQAISEVTKVPIEGSTEVLRPWHLGHFTGKESKVALPLISKYVSDKPDEKIPDGESFNEFKNRFLGGLESILDKYKDKNVLLVAHHRNERLLHAWDKSGRKEREFDMPTFLSKGIPPGEYVVFTK